MIRLVLLIGLPGSGKSSLIRFLQRDFQYLQVISTDKIRGQLFGDESIQGPWMWVWREVSRQLQEAVKDAHLGRIHTVIYDATNVQRKQRQRVIKLARAIAFNQIIGVWVNTPLQLCLERNNSRDRIVPEDIILKMNVYLQDAPPSLDDGFDDLIIL
jgi:predicted kinase